MKIEILHRTSYIYETPALDSVNEVRLTPRTNYRQSCYHHEVEVTPSCSLFTYEDYFGNRVHAYSVSAPHDSMTITVKSTVVTQKREQGAGRPRLPLNEQKLLLENEAFRDRYIEFLLPTDYTEQTPELQSFMKRQPIGNKEDLYAWARDLSSTIYNEFTYDPEATNVETTVKNALQLKRGVCQDYAHLMIAACRNVGMPARYVSGYHFIGDLQGGNADFEQASHAWVEVHIPGTGWLGFDPTNNAEVNWRYVKLGHGRDYKDIVPVKGVYKGGTSRLDVTVDVRLAED
ncbi:transglutaminase family protein [Saccharibacillus sp. CPCC 101409]|uniref:transglutaminase family protein n=1 Tax=Saccharibacillus sp. CPCC 101409 TaxID=3058041 RepID=UPI00267281CF|nr:transglutaminase family protein [Saccharibacillus sp. CPCC 101409]MDO3410367.1 transglutaminase family protein [Saccharibacillus sp. CPCC 101409]